jgi:hypothetical protein
MPDPIVTLTLALTSLAAIAVLAVAGLTGFRGWLDLKRAELSSRSEPAPASPITARIDIADLKERIRKLEAIAAGVDI